MALEVLAGPAAISVDAVPVSSFGSDMSNVFIQGLGLLAFVCLPAGGGASFGTYAVQLDGTAQLRAPFLAVAPNIMLDLRSSRGLVYCDGFSYYNLDWRAARPDVVPFRSPGAGLIVTLQVVCADRFLRISGNQVLASPITDGGTFTLEYTFPGTAPGGQVTVSRTGSETVVCIGWGSSPGQIRFYDVVAKAQVGSVLYVGEANEGLWYVPKYDIFVELKTKQLKILANQVLPATLSSPTASGAVTAGRVTTMTAQLLGAQGEPCAGELVNWLISAGAGSLTQTQSVTDANGNGTTGYVAPIGGSGSATVQAAVNF